MTAKYGRTICHDYKGVKEVIIAFIAMTQPLCNK